MIRQQRFPGIQLLMTLARGGAALNQLLNIMVDVCTEY